MPSSEEDWVTDSGGCIGGQGVIAELILYHGYDHWGFSCMGMDHDKQYLRYLGARVGAYSNVCAHHRALPNRPRSAAAARASAEPRSADALCAASCPDARSTGGPARV